MAASNSSDLTATNNDGGTGRDTTQHSPLPPQTDDQRRQIELLLWNLSSSSERGNDRFPSTSDQPTPLSNFFSPSNNYSFPLNTITDAVTEILDNTGSAVNQSFNAAINPIFRRREEILENQETEDFKINTDAIPTSRIANDYRPPRSTLISNLSFPPLAAAGLPPTPSSILESRIGNYPVYVDPYIYDPNLTATNPIADSSDNYSFALFIGSIFSPSHIDSTQSLPVTTSAATTVSEIFDDATNPIVQSSDLGNYSYFSSDIGSSSYQPPAAAISAVSEIINPIAGGVIDIDHEQETEIFNSALVNPRPRIDYEYPPPAMSTLNGDGRSRFTYRSLREDGRLVVRMARNRRNYIVQQHREGGHLKMTLVPNQNSDEEAEKDTIDNNNGGEDNSQKELLKTIPLVFRFILAFLTLKN